MLPRRIASHTASVSASRPALLLVYINPNALAISRRILRAEVLAEFRQGLAAVRLGLLTFVLIGPLAAQSLTDGGTRIALSARPTSPAVAQSDVAGFAAKSHATATQRISSRP